MESLVKHYIQEAKEGIEVDGVVVSLLNKSQAGAILTKNGINNQTFEKVIKMITDYYNANIANNKAKDFMPDTNIKATFPNIKYIQDIVIRSYICHVIDNDINEFNNLLGEDEKIKNQSLHDITLNMAITQLKKIYKINSLKFTKIFKKEDKAITSAEIIKGKAEIEKQIKFDTMETIPDNIKELVIKNTEKITNIDVKKIKEEIKNVHNIVIDDTAIKNANKYLTAIRETFSFLTDYFKKISIKDLKKSQKIIEDADKNNDTIFIKKIKDILKTLGHIGTGAYSLKEDFSEMNVVAWCLNVLNLKAYHTGIDDFSDITSDLEKKVISILNKYKPAQRNSYDAYHLVEDFIEICRDQTDVKISHEVADLLLIQIVKDFLIKANDEVNNFLTVSNKMNKTKVIEVKKDEEGNVTQIVNNTPEKQRHMEIKKMVTELSNDVAEARKFFFNLYGGLTTFNGSSWESLDVKTQNKILKAAKLNRNNAEFLQLKLNKKIENATGINPENRDTEELEKLKKEFEDKLLAERTENANNFINKFNNLSAKQIEGLKIKYGIRYQAADRLIKNYEKTGKINEKIKAIMDDNSENKLAQIIRIIPPNGSTSRLEESTEKTSLLNKYMSLINENK